MDRNNSIFPAFSLAHKDTSTSEVYVGNLEIEKFLQAQACHEKCSDDRLVPRLLYGISPWIPGGMVEYFLGILLGETAWQAFVESRFLDIFHWILLDVFRFSTPVEEYFQVLPIVPIGLWTPVFFQPSMCEETANCHGIEFFDFLCFCIFTEHFDVSTDGSVYLPTHAFLAESVLFEFPVKIVIVH